MRSSRSDPETRELHFRPWEPVPGAAAKPSGRLRMHAISWSWSDLEPSSACRHGPSSGRTTSRRGCWVPRGGDFLKAQGFAAHRAGALNPDRRSISRKDWIEGGRKSPASWRRNPGQSGRGDRQLLLRARPDRGGPHSRPTRPSATWKRRSPRTQVRARHIILGACSLASGRPRRRDRRVEADRAAKPGVSRPRGAASAESHRSLGRGAEGLTLLRGFLSSFLRSICRRRVQSTLTRRRRCGHKLCKGRVCAAARPCSAWTSCSMLQLRSRRSKRGLELDSCATWCIQPHGAGSARYLCENCGFRPGQF